MSTQKKPLSEIIGTVAVIIVAIGCVAVLFFTTILPYILSTSSGRHCSIHEPCEENVGDCHWDTDCMDGLFCGYGNCAPELGYDPGVDCCYRPKPGDEQFCNWENRCGKNEGDCNQHGDCKDDLLCGIDNCPSELGFASSADCCFNVTEEKTQWPWGRDDWGQGIPYGNTNNPDFSFWQEGTHSMVERRLIKEPYFWYAQEVIAGTHNRKGDTVDEEGNVITKNEQWGHRN